MAEAQSLAEGLNFSRTLDAEPTLHVTIQWALAPADIPVPDRIQLVINRAGAWLRRRHVKVVWAYVREGGLRKGEHLHCMIFVPRRHQADFKKALWGWVTADATGDVQERAVDVEPIWGRLHTGLMRYLLKNGTDQVRNTYWLPARAKYRRTEGVIFGRRVKLSRSIDRAARAKAGS